MDTSHSVMIYIQNYFLELALERQTETEKVGDQQDATDFKNNTASADDYILDKESLNWQMSLKLLIGYLSGVMEKQLKVKLL